MSKPTLPLTFLLLLPAGATRAQTTAVVYLDGAGAPAPLHARIEERLQAALADQGIPLATPAPAPAGSGEGSMAAARHHLDQGLAAYRKLSLEAARAELVEAEQAALSAPELPPAASIATEARIYEGLIAMALGGSAEGEKLLRRAVVLDPERTLDKKTFSPEQVSAWERARKTVLSGAHGEVVVALEGEAAQVLVDGRPLPSGALRLAYGEHLVSVTGPDGSSVGEKVVVGEPHATVSLKLAADPSRLAASARAALKRGDEPALLRALGEIAVAEGASRVLAWDLRSVSGRVEAPLRLLETGEHATSRVAVADLGSAAVSPDRPLRSALATLLAAGNAPDLPTIPPEPPSTHPRPRWIWLAAGGAAAIALGGTAAALANQSHGHDTVAVQVAH